MDNLTNITPVSCVALSQLTEGIKGIDHYHSSHQFGILMCGLVSEIIILSGLCYENSDMRVELNAIRRSLR